MGVGMIIAPLTQMLSAIEGEAKELNRRLLHLEVPDAHVAATLAAKAMDALEKVRTHLDTYGRRRV